MTNWLPEMSDHAGPRYRAIADALEIAMRSGRVLPGTRLPTHRELAWRLKVTVGTVSRAYAEAERRGLITGEVGRGTFVRPLGRTLPPGPTAASPAADFVDLSINRPRAPDEARRFAEALEQIAHAPDLDRLLDYHPHAGHPADRDAGARWIARSGPAAASAEIIVTAGGQHAMACVLSAITRPGDAVAVEALTYNGMRSLATHLHLRLVPLVMDEQGVLPDALDAACRAGPVRAAYLLPTLHNPTTATLPVERRQALAEIARRNGVLLVEDDIYGFLVENPLPPLASFAPEHAFYLTGMSKALMPGLRIGYVRAPADHIDRIAAAVRSTVYSATPLMARMASLWIDDGTADDLVAAKRAEARRRQEMVRDLFARQDYRSDPAAAHVWLMLPEPWRAEDFAAAAHRRGVGITPAAAFSVARQAPNAVRVCIGTPPTLDELSRGLTGIAELLRESPEPYLSVV